MSFPVFVLLLLPLIYLAVGCGIFLYACFRGKDTQWMDPDSVRKTVYAPYADVIPKAHKWIMEHNPRDVYIRSHDGLKLHGIFIPAENAIGTAILFHGYRSTYLLDFSAIYRVYNGWGYNLLLVDQRSHGCSEGKFITFGVKESRDVAAWVDWHNQTLGKLPLFLCGMSMGSSTVMFAAGNPLPENVKGITADCGFTSPYDIICHVAAGTVGSRLARCLMPAVSFWSRCLGGFGLKECSTEQTLKNITVPILMIHGTADDYVPCEMTKRSFAACRGEKELVLVEGAGHGVSYLVDRERVESALSRFFRQNNPSKTGESL